MRQMLAVEKLIRAAHGVEEPATRWQTCCLGVLEDHTLMIEHWGGGAAATPRSCLPGHCATVPQCAHKSVRPEVTFTAPSAVQAHPGFLCPRPPHTSAPAAFAGIPPARPASPKRQLQAAAHRVDGRVAMQGLGAQSAQRRPPRQAGHLMGSGCQVPQAQLGGPQPHKQPDGGQEALACAPQQPPQTPAAAKCWGHVRTAALWGLSGNTSGSWPRCIVVSVDGSISGAAIKAMQPAAEHLLPACSSGMAGQLAHACEGTVMGTGSLG